MARRTCRGEGVPVDGIVWPPELDDVSRAGVDDVWGAEVEDGKEEPHPATMNTVRMARRSAEDRGVGDVASMVR